MKWGTASRSGEFIVNPRSASGVVFIKLSKIFIVLGLPPGVGNALGRKKRHSETHSEIFSIYIWVRE